MKITYSLEEFTVFLHKNRIAEGYNNWMARGFAKDYKPHIERIDQSRGFDIDNIQLTIPKEIVSNDPSAHPFQVDNIRTRVVLAINDRLGEYLIFKSTKQAANHFSVATPVIYQALSRKSKIRANGGGWSFVYLPSLFFFISEYNVIKFQNNNITAINIVSSEFTHEIKAGAVHLFYYTPPLSARKDYAIHDPIFYQKISEYIISNMGKPEFSRIELFKGA